MSESNTKARILFLEHYLTEHTDEQHMVTAEELMKICEDNGYKANRNTLRDDIAVLQEQSVDVIIDHVGKFKAFYIGMRLFESAEIKTLIDAVSSSRFITAEKSEALIEKLSQLTCKHDRQSLINSSVSSDRIKTESTGIFLTIDTVNTAINERKKISFQYVDYLPTKEEILRHEGKKYVVSPQALLWNDDRYYVPSYSEEKKGIIPFRIDRMRNVGIIDEQAFKDHEFVPSEYSRKVLKMYDGDIPEKKVVIEADNKYLINVIDRFGEDVETKQLNEDRFSAQIFVKPSSTFFAWVFQFRGEVIITAPNDVKENYIKMLTNAVDSQK
ncbi:MAG: WYL domain-containing protein [Ruminococcus sp.]|uniref:helix-turn-helix transcriptional regulator n=1 Tax=Ruminococcus sp. TaxID=41978 RepID=UPI0025EA8672|nr:WYL domain-containing protein [Ruminococcus sp.]MCR5540840.1 WYL domain-containing protein [Ruminococcus sp.]